MSVDIVRSVDILLTSAVRSSYTNFILSAQMPKFFYFYFEIISKINILLCLLKYIKYYNSLFVLYINHILVYFLLTYYCQLQ